MDGIGIMTECKLNTCNTIASTEIDKSKSTEETDLHFWGVKCLLSMKRIH